MDALHEQLLPTFRHLLPPGSRVIVGTSGGPDSQVLLHLLAQLRDRLQLGGLWALGVDHGLRAAATQELRLAQALAHDLGVPFAALPIHVARSGNLLSNARRARYDSLRCAMTRQGATQLAVAHTASDQVEGILMNLCRGATLRGAAGMRAQRGALVRPLLHVPRRCILAYAEAHGLAFAQDPSNSDPRRARPRLRAGLPAVLSSINPRYAEHFAAFAEQAQEDAQLLDQWARRELQALGPSHAPLPMEVLAGLPAPIGRRMLCQWIAAQSAGALAPAVLQTLWSLRRERSARGQWPLKSAGLRLDRGLLWCEREVSHYEISLPIPGKLAIPGFAARVLLGHQEAGWGGTSHFAQPEAEGVAFDGDRLHFGLKLRPWQPGDRIRPFGLNGSIKVGDLFTNAKIPRALRARWPIITHGSEVLWVVGLRRGQGAAVGQKTKRLITLKLDKALLESAC